MIAGLELGVGVGLGDGPGICTTVAHWAFR